MKRLKPVVKYDKSDKYVFVGGVADTGMTFKGEPIKVTLQEFKQLKEKHSGTKN